MVVKRRFTPSFCLFLRVYFSTSFSPYHSSFPPPPPPPPPSPYISPFQSHLPPQVMLLKSLSTMCKSCAEALKTLPPSPLSTEGADPPTPLTRALVDRVAPAVISQCKKKDLSYKSAALECLGGVVGALQVDVFATAFEDVISPILEPKVCVQLL